MVSKEAGFTEKRRCVCNVFYTDCDWTASCRHQQRQPIRNRHNFYPSPPPPIYYCPQRSCGKVMFLHLSVILSTGGVSAPVHAGIHTPLARHPPGQTPPPPRTDTHPLGRHPPTQCNLGYTPTLPSAFWEAHTPPAQCILGYTSLCPVHFGIHPPAQCMLGYTWLLLRTVHILVYTRFQVQEERVCMDKHLRSVLWVWIHFIEINKFNYNKQSCKHFVIG